MKRMVITKDCMLKASKNSEMLYELDDVDRSKLKKCLMEIYSDIESVCKKHKITVMLAYGSVLGAIRHKGFIPWDDDMDIMMPRKDFQKFVKIFKKELSKKYVLYAPTSEEGVARRFAQIIKKNTRFVDVYNVNTSFEKGICLDLFIIDNVPENQIIRNIKGRFADLIGFIGASVYIKKFDNQLTRDFMESTKRGKRNYKIRLLIGTVFSFFSYEKWYRIFDKIVSKEEKSEYYSDLTGLYLAPVMKKDIFVPPVEAEFEGRKVMIPNNADIYLKKIYGDYMKIPPVEKRERHYFVEFNIGEE